ncbi:hypothetical protein DFH08DRAFT_961565 [Mycena albidolilacea]|uniref:Uncharacterized protein n=1 Tax=Mycena albidolilacea TaxID=1033008 RepID=A0AAD6ZYK2_9AGAR|nr:hypothetical protein DFH08DRAFT_961565 [Mycena albidolilacea]
MASVVQYGSPFVETEKLPPPAVLLLLQTNLNVSTSTGPVIHEDLEHPMPSTKKTVVFAPVLEHVHPPPLIFKEKIPTPMIYIIIENHDAWEGGDRETIIIKTTVHALVDKLLDTTKLLSDQDPELMQEVFQQAAQMHPDLGKYENNCAMCCIIQARLKATSSNASNKVAKVVADVIQMGWHTHTKSNKQ